MKNSNIKELILGPTDNNLLMDFNGISISQADALNTWHYLAFVEDTLEVIIYQSTNKRSKLTEAGNSLIEYLISIKTHRFRDLLFVCTLYPLLMPRDYRIKRSPFCKKDLSYPVRKILNIGKGYFFYYHQLEILYSLLTNCSHEESFLFRRDWNLKKSYTRDIASKTMVTQNCSLLDFIIHFSIDNNLFFYQANYYGANLLCKLRC